MTCFESLLLPTRSQDLRHLLLQLLWELITVNMYLDTCTQQVVCNDAALGLFFEWRPAMGGRRSKS